MKYRYPDPGSTRGIEKFLFFPKTLAIHSHTYVFERRWLEKAKIKQVVKTDTGIAKWYNICWMN